MSWFASWFDSPFYHILYQHRDDAEAKFFLDNLVKELNPAEGARLLDLGCGKGRHAIYLHSKGFSLVGADLSPESIAAANKFQKDGLNFVVHDMRNPLALGNFDGVLNLFTSFGYFDTEEEHLQVLQAARTALDKTKGFFLIDFMNAATVVKNLQLAELKTVQGINFDIRRYVENRKIIKEIRFEAEGQKYFFSEMVNAFFLEDFERMLSKSVFTIEKIWGNYALESFDATSADRLIILAKPC